jgi:ATP-dependent helicase HrpA
VAIRLFDEPLKAQLAMKRGLRRLLMIQLEEPIRSLVEHTPGVDRLTLAYAAIGDRAALRSEICELVGMRAFDDLVSAAVGGAGAARTTAWSKGPIRTKELFDQAVEAGWNRLGASAEEVFGLVRDLLAAHQPVAARVGRAGETWNGAREWAGSIADMREQMSVLVYPGFLSRTPWKWLRQYPRYLLGISTRLEKLAGSGLPTPADGLARDQRMMNEVLPFWRAWREAEAAKHKPSAGPGGQDLGEEPELEEFRWMVEEFRVSVFAQNLQTLVPVSSKRLLAQWEKARAARERLLASAGKDA